MNIRLFRAAALAWPAVLTVSPIHAQAPASVDDPEVPSIIITADPFADRSPVEATQPTEVLAGEELRESLGNTLGETLANELGVHSSDFGAGSSRPVIRGLGGPRVRVLDGGSGVIDASTVSPDHNVSVEPFRARQIEVLKGPASLLYGSGAIGGVINIVSDLIPRRPVAGWHGSVGSSLNSVDEGRSAHGHVETGNGRFALHLDGLIRRTEDYDIPGFANVDGAAEEDAERGSVENTAVDTDSIALGTAWTGESGYFGVGVTRYESLYGIPGHGHEEEGHAEEGHAEEEEEGGVKIDLEQTRYDLRGGWNAPVGPFERLRGSLVLTEYDHLEIEPEGAHAQEEGAAEEEEGGTLFANDGLEFRLEATHRRLAGWQGVFGVQLVDQEFSAVGEEAFVPPVDTRSNGLFLVEEREFGAHRLSLGLRGETVDHEAADNSDRDFDLFSASAGVHFELTAGQHLNLNVASAQRAPDVQELYSDGPHLATRTFEQGNAALDKETALNFDLGLSGEYGAWFYQLDLFYTNYSDFIFAAEKDENGDGEADFVNEEGELEVDGELLAVDFTQSDAEFRGFEARLGYALTSDHELTLFGDLVRAELANGDPLPRIPASRVGLRYDGNSGLLSYGLQFQRVNRQDRVTELEGESAGYNLLSADLAATLPVADGDLRVALRGRNLLDEKARNHVSFLKDLAPLPGLNLGLDLEYRF